MSLGVSTMRQQWYTRLQLGTLLLFLILGLIALYMKKIVIESNYIPGNNVDIGLNKNAKDEVIRQSNELKSEEYKDNEADKDKISQALVTIAHTTDQPTSTVHSKEKESENETVDDLLATKDSKTYFEREMDKLNKEKVAQDDQRLVKLIREHFIVPPSNEPYNLFEMDKLDTSKGQAAFVDNRLEFKENGFFFESGAHDGEHLSNTLFFERTRHWSGVLIEPLPDAFNALMRKHRRAYAINACLSLHSYPSMEYFTTIPIIGKIVQVSDTQRYDQEKKVRVQCLPLYSILLALNRTHVDFLSLDVEGIEKSVLDVIPWDKVDIEMLAVEYDKWPGGTEKLCEYMKARGYECSIQITAPAAADTIFRKIR